MPNPAEKQMIEQLRSVIAAADQIISGSVYDDLSDVSEADVRLGLSRLRAAVERLSSANSSYTRDLKQIDSKGWHGGQGLLMYRGVAQSLLDDMVAGYTRSIQELIHSDVFSDYFDMAEHILDAGYKDAAAVITGSTLEGHLRNLCRKHGVDVERTTSQGNVPKKADALNSDLATAGVYGKLDQKNVTAWLDLRNKAAHGHYAEYTKEQVTLLLNSVRDFVTRLPA
jgi:hypothetical protein